MSDLEDYLDTMRGLISGALTEIDPNKPGDLQAFRDACDEQAQRGVRIEMEEEQ